MVVLLVLTVVVNVVTNASATRTDAVKTVSAVPTVVLATVPAVAVRSVSASNSLNQLKYIPAFYLNTSFILYRHNQYDINFILKIKTECYHCSVLCYK